MQVDFTTGSSKLLHVRSSPDASSCDDPQTHRVAEGVQDHRQLERVLAGMWQRLAGAPAPLGAGLSVSVVSVPP